jgi:CDGSH-type Zn-finger protein
MKYITPVALLFGQAAAFTAVPQPVRLAGTILRAGDYEPIEGEGKINLKVRTPMASAPSALLYLDGLSCMHSPSLVFSLSQIDLDSPKVATMDDIEKGKKVYCRCWLSGTFPLCDGTHQKHNEATGDNVGPLIVAVKKA